MRGRFEGRCIRFIMAAFPTSVFCPFSFSVIIKLRHTLRTGKTLRIVVVRSANPAIIPDIKSLFMCPQTLSKYKQILLTFTK